MNATRFVGVAVMLVTLTASMARANGGTVTMDGDRAVVFGRLRDGVIVVNDALAFALHKEGLGLVSSGSWVRAEGTVLSGPRLLGRRALLRLQQDQLEVLAEDPDVVTSDAGGLAGAIDGGPYERAQGDPVVLLQAAVGSALADGRLERDEWTSLQAAWRIVERDGKSRGLAARWLTSGSDAHRAIYTGLCGDMPWEVVARLLGQAEVVVPTAPIVPSTLAATHDATSGPHLLDAGRTAGRVLNELFKELKHRLDRLKAAVRERVQALNAQASLTQAQVEEVYDLYQDSANTGAAYGAVSAVLTEEGGKAYKAWQASRCAGGRARVYANYKALDGR